MDALRRARLDAGLSQTEVAARMHTSASSIARLERVAQNSTLQTVQEYASALGKSLTWSLDDGGPIPSPTWLWTTGATGKAVNPVGRS